MTRLDQHPKTLRIWGTPRRGQRRLAHPCWWPIPAISSRAHSSSSPRRRKHRGCAEASTSRRGASG